MKDLARRWASRLVSIAKYRAKRRGIKFSLKPEDIVESIREGLCEATGIPFVFEARPGGHPFAPSIDRVNPTKGYVRSNVQVVLYSYNSAKGRSSPEDIIRLADCLRLKKHKYLEE